MDTYPLMVGFSLAIGVGLIVNTSLSSIYLLGRRWFWLIGRRRYRLQALGIDNPTKGSQSEDEILGLTQIPWTNLYAGAAVLGLALFFFIGPSVPSMRLGFLTAPALVWLFKGYLAGQRRRFLLGQLRQLLIDVRLHMSLRGSLLLGLENIASTTGEDRLVYRLLRLRMSGGQVKSGLEVFQQMAKDLKSVHLTRIAQRIQAAQQSGGLLGVDQAVAKSIEELTDEINGQTEEQMQRLPLRITLLAMPFLLGPIVILFFYPLVDRILKTLSGTTIGGGF
ncbi:MAG: hypothetical protein HY835_03475 [Anaerolineae bacterium]|nr:hypothetical protein [Anaerolineae bacterium]